jgi:hypothetical protein
MQVGEVTRRGLLRQGTALGLFGAAAFVVPRLASAQGGESVGQHAEILDLFAAFHRAKSKQDLALMVSLYTDDCKLTNLGTTPPSVFFSGKDALTTFWRGSGPFNHHRIALVTAFKDQAQVHGNTADFYFECHDVALESTDPGIIPGGAPFTLHGYNAGTLRKVKGHWLFDQTFTGPSPLALPADKIYYP